MKAALAVALTLALALAAGGCDDPAKGKTKVTTSEAQPVTAAHEGASTYAFDGTTSRVEWVGAKVTGKHDGGFKSFRGTVKLDPAAPEKGTVSVEIDTASLFTDNDKLEGHLKSADFFDVEKHPKASFVSTSASKADGKWKITGNLTLHGVTKSITFPADVRVGSASVDVDAEFAINRKDFGIVYAGKPDDLIRDDVVIKLAIRATKQSS